MCALDNSEGGSHVARLLMPRQHLRAGVLGFLCVSTDERTQHSKTVGKSRSETLCEAKQGVDPAQPHIHPVIAGVPS